MRTRWISIGHVMAGWYVRRGHCGFPGGLRMLWQGRIQFGQPTEFLHWEHLLWAVRRRLHFVGLEVLAIASRIHGRHRSSGYTELVVQVARFAWVPV